MYVISTKKQTFLLTNNQHSHNNTFSIYENYLKIKIIFNLKQKIIKCIICLKYYSKF